MGHAPKRAIGKNVTCTLLQ